LNGPSKRLKVEPPQLFLGPFGRYGKMLRATCKLLHLIQEISMTAEQNGPLKKREHSSQLNGRAKRAVFCDRFNGPFFKTHRFARPSKTVKRTV
jgi:hypothetical protein